MAYAKICDRCKGVYARNSFTADYRVREQSDSGWIDEGFYSEATVSEWLEHKLEEPA